MSLIGNPVKFGDGPTAVIGDEHRILPLSVLNTDGKARQAPVEDFKKKFYSTGASRMIQESEDRPE